MPLLECLQSLLGPVHQISFQAALSRAWSIPWGCCDPGVGPFALLILVLLALVHWASLPKPLWGTFLPSGRSTLLPNLLSSAAGWGSTWSPCPVDKDIEQKCYHYGHGCIINNLGIFLLDQVSQIPYFHFMRWGPPKTFIKGRTLTVLVFFIPWY